MNMQNMKAKDKVFMTRSFHDFHLQSDYRPSSSDQSAAKQRTWRAK